MAESDDTHKALNLDLVDQQAFVSYYNNLPEKSLTTIRFFNRTGYYTVHGNDANLVSKSVSIPLKYMGDNPKLSYICLNNGHFEKMVRELLLEKQYRVEVYIKASSGKTDWKLEYKGSPGNLTQFEELLNQQYSINFLTNSVMGVKTCPNNVLAISCVNITEAKFEVCELEENECFSELESIIAQIGPKECVISTGESSDLLSIRNTLERNGILVAEVKRSDFSIDGIEQDLSRLLFFHDDQERNLATYTETNLKGAMSCLQAVIKFLNLTTDSRNFNQFKLSTLEPHRFVRLDSAALQALHVFPQTQSQISENAAVNPMSKINSLKGILDNCETTQGRRLLVQWIKQPLKDIHLINERLDIVESLATDAETRTRLKEYLPCFMDLMPVSKKMACKKANLQDCFRVYQTISGLPKLIQLLRNTHNKCISTTLTDSLNDIRSDVQKYQDMIEQSLDLNLVDKGIYLVKAELNNDLNELHSKKHKLEEMMQKEHEMAANDLDAADRKVKLDFNDDLGFFLKISGNAQTIRNKKYKMINVLKSGGCFTTEKMTELNERHRACIEEYKEKQEDVVNEILEIVAGYVDCFRNLNKFIATIDVLVSFAVTALAGRIPYVRPKLYENAGILKLKKVRHPCLEARDNISFIPNDVTFSHENKTMHIVTGPNMCGKSTYIRSIGISVLMAHIGSFVPCSKAEISVVDGILVRVGADDCPLKGLSTFMLEMIETASILKSATKNSLVIIDELGRGTSTYDGCGIAWAIADYLVTEVKCFTLFATHFHEMSKLADVYDSVSNLHVTAMITKDMITPLYQILEGECDKSYAIQCAKMVDFPEDVIQDAKEYQKRLEYCNGLKYIENLQGDIKRQLIAEGDSIIKDTLKKLSENVDKISDEDLSKMLEDMKSDLLSKNNLFIKGLLTVD